jgi:Mn2+/Fe2+ NRAMP family transporter
VAWLGPGFLWMVSAAGSGELLFTPRIGALYGYTLLWALLAAVALKWFINREIGRFSVCTGKSILEGFRTIPGPRDWALWLILVPQLLVATATIAGLAGAAATALALVLPGDVRLWMAGSVLASTALVLWGRYRGVERAATVIAVALGVASVAAAATVFPRPGALGAGLVPGGTPDVDYAEVLPWLGFMLSGAAGMIWYSYWVLAKGYGAGGADGEGPRIDPNRLGAGDRARLRGWLAQMTLDNTVAVVGTLVVTLAFLILGVEMLQPRGLLPEEDRVAEVLGRLLGGMWGPVGFWFMVAAVFVGFWDTVLADQDGFGRMFANGTRLLAPGLRGRWADEALLQRTYLLVLLTVLPIGLYLAAGEPVGLLKLAGAVEAAHIPVVAGLTLYLNRRRLPEGLRPSWPTSVCTVLAAIFFTAFAGVYVLQLVSGDG